MHGCTKHCSQYPRLQGCNKHFCQYPHIEGCTKPNLLLLSADCLLSHIETSNADSVQRKQVWNKTLKFSISSADHLLSADCLLSHLKTSNAHSAQSKEVWNKILKFSMSSADC